MRSPLSLSEKSSMRVSNGSKAGLFRHGQPTAHLGGSVKSFCGISLSKATADKSALEVPRLPISAMQ
jgi:hypothetical protein